MAFPSTFYVFFSLALRKENFIVSCPEKREKKLEIDSSNVNLSPLNHNKTYRTTEFHWQTTQSNVLYEV